MKAQTLWALVLLAIFAPSAWSAQFYFEGKVTEATDGLAILTPIGTKVTSVFEFSDTAVESGEAGASDVLTAGVRFGGFCFGHNDDCNFGGSLVAFLFDSDSSIQFDKTGNITGGFLNGVGFSPTFNLPVPIAIDFEQNTITIGYASVGIAIATGDVFTITPVDSDDDGQHDEIDNCLMIANPDQEDVDADGFGNACDPDFDNNCVVNFPDLHLLARAFNFHTDDVDLTGDGWIGFQDVDVFRTFFTLAPGPSAVAECP